MANSRVKQGLTAVMLFGWALLGVPLHAVELAHSALRVEAGYGYALEDQSALETAFEINLESEFVLGDSWDLVLSGRLRLDAENRLLDPEDVYDSYSHVSRPLGLGAAGYAELRDAYLEYNAGNAQVRLGKQQIVWGALDGLKVTDVLNPQSFREFILEPFDESRIGTWAAYADVIVNDLRMEFAWLPDETTHDLAEAGDWFEFSAPRFRLGMDAVGAEASAAVVVQGQPDRELARGALRLSAPVGSVTVSAIAANTLDYEPTVVVAGVSDQPVFERRFHDLRLYGLTLEGATGPLALRAEAAYRPKRYFNGLSATGLVEERRDQWTVALAADIDAPFDTFVNLQVLADWVEKGRMENELVRPRTDVLATALVRKQFFYDTLTVDLRWYSDLKLDDGLYRVELNYAVNDAARVRLNYDNFYGTSQGLFGQFAEQDRVSVSLAFTF